MKKKKDRLDGSKQSIAEYNLFFYGVYDPDMGILNYYSKDTQLKIWELCKPTLSSYEGKIIIFGTGGEINETIDYSSLFYDPESYNIIDK